MLYLGNNKIKSKNKKSAQKKEVEKRERELNKIKNALNEKENFEINKRITRVITKNNAQ